MPEGENGYKKVDLTTINNGAAVELFDEHFKKVMANINDLTVESLAAREITIKVKVKPSKDRRTAQTVVQVSSKLPDIAEHESAILLGNNCAYQADANQLTMFEKQED